MIGTEKRNFKLKEDQKRYLIEECGYFEDDMEQIEEGTNLAIFTLETKQGDERRLTLQQVQDVLTETDFLSGIARAAFHWTSVRYTKNNKSVHMNMSGLFTSESEV